MQNSINFPSFTAVDRIRLRRDLVASAARSKALKALLRATWQRPMAEEQRALAELRKVITGLCALAATLRGRSHLARAEQQAILAARVARHYEIVEEPCSSSTSA